MDTSKVPPRYDPATLARIRRGVERTIGIDPAATWAFWRRAQEARCRAGAPHFARLIDPKTGTVIVQLPPCTHAGVEG